MKKDFFSIEKRNNETKARIGKIKTVNSIINTPVFLPVATQATVKTLSNQHLQQIGVEAFITNAYHLYLRPGIEIISSCGGLHKFIGWQKSIVTDSGGFQLYSLANLRKITEEGVEFQSHIDGSLHFFSPEKIIQIQCIFGADIIMCLDECHAYPVNYEYAKKSMELTLKWAKKCKQEFEIQKEKFTDKKFSNLFGIIQGGTYNDLRKESLIKTVEIDFDGYAFGGLAVGEPKETMYEIIQNYTQLLPENKLRYAMGVGSVEDIWFCVSEGIDIFDCVLPTRNGRNGQAITGSGKINIKNSKYKNDFTSLDPECNCLVCATYNRAYIHHLFRSGEILALTILTFHNIFFIMNLFKIIYSSIKEDVFIKTKQEFLKKYSQRQDY